MRGATGCAAECVLDLLRRGFPEVARDARAQRRADRCAPRAAARHGALRVGGRLPSPAPGRAISASGTRKDDCGACDYCLGELEAVAGRRGDRAQDPVVRRARRSAVRRRACRQRAVRQRQRAGQGSRARALTTFGLLRDAPLAEVRGYIEQLTAEELLRQTDDAYPGARADRAGRCAVEERGGARGLTLARQRRPTRDRPSTRTRADVESWQDVDRELFDRLRALRLQIARDRGVPPYVIFHDTTLRELARRKPVSLDRAARASTALGRARRNSWANPS